MKASQFLINNSCSYRDAQIKSHKYMLRAGLLLQLASGIYVWGPIGVYVLRKVEDVIHTIHRKQGIIEFLAPIAQPTSLWKESGRYDAYGSEALRFHDRHEHEFIYGPTAEEIAAHLMRTYDYQYGTSIYQIQWKFRDEVRPRYGIIRSREFLMKDAYSFDATVDDAMNTYIKFFNIYMCIFRNLELTVYPFLAESGPIGGSYTHEFHVLSDIGDSDLYYDHQLEPNKFFHEYKSFGTTFKSDHIVQPQSKGIEVGQTFLIGDQYTTGKCVMGCYGIGVSRLVAAIVEQYYNEDQDRMYWPDSVCMFHYGIIPGDTSNEALSKYNQFNSEIHPALYDDRDIDIPTKIKDMKLIGAKHILVIRQDSIRYLTQDNNWITIDIDYMKSLS